MMTHFYKLRDNQIGKLLLRSQAVFTIAIALSILCHAFPVSAQPKNSWQGIYLFGRKIGNSAIKIENASYQGKSVLKITTDSHVSIQIMNSTTKQDTQTITYADASYTPLYQDYKIISNGSTLHLIATYYKDHILCKIDTGQDTTTKSVPIPKGVSLAEDSDNPIKGKKAKPGTSTVCYSLNPLTVMLEKSVVDVLSQADVVLNGVKYNAYHVSATGPMGRILSWESVDGDTLEAEMPMGMSVYMESSQDALASNQSAPDFHLASGKEQTAPAWQPPQDFALATAISSNEVIKDARNTHSLIMQISGLSNSSLILSDQRQQAVEEKPDIYLYTIKAVSFDKSHAAELPIKDPVLQKYLSSAPYLDINDPAIKKIAQQLRGNDTDAYIIAARIRVWVHDHMKPDATIGVPRSCASILSRPVGVCRDYATLYAGIARAAGIPTRLASGIVYANGKFFYHAWAESWLGDWVAIDPTLESSFVDATHIKFAQGDVTDMYQVGGLIGNISVKVISAQ
jgi:hypothetical protein